VGLLLFFAIPLCWTGLPLELEGQTAPQTQPVQAPGPRELAITAGKSVVIDSPVDIRRVAVANGDIAEAVVVTPREVVVNGKLPGQTTLIVWQESGNRLLFDLTIYPNASRVDAVRREIRQTLKGQDVSVDVQDKTVFLRGTVNNLVSAERAASIAGSLGKVVNLLNVSVPPPDTQVLLQVRFANVDRAAVSELAVNLFSTGATNTIGSTTTGQFQSPRIVPKFDGTGNELTLTDALNVFLFRRDINLGATIRALQNRRLLEILAEPNVLASDGRPASFLAGGEFPYPTLQGGGAGLGAVTIQFREFGVRLDFLPTVTPRGTIHLQVTPEVSALDYANGLVFQGFTIPGLNTRRVQTEIELEPGQSFAIAGLLDRRITESLSKIPGLGDIPLLGKLFQSRSLTKNNTELLVMVTPEVVRPMPAGQHRPDIDWPRKDFITDRNEPPRTPGVAITGPVPVRPPEPTMAVEELVRSQRPPAAGSQNGAGGQYTAPAIQFMPVPVMPVQPAPAPAPQAEAAPAAPPASGSQ
jgi:pilus assembly protein CpaC